MRPCPSPSRVVLLRLPPTIQPKGVTLMSSSTKFEAEGGATISRRTLVGTAGATAATLVAGRAFAQATPGPVAPPSTVTSPPRDFSPRGAPTTYFTDPDILSIDPSFDALRQPNSAIQRLWTGALW